jgi:hypothetical protein
VDAALDACKKGCQCQPGDVRCAGPDAQECNGAGVWVTTQICTSGCFGGSCAASCFAGDTRCAGTSSVQVCVGGQWSLPMACDKGTCQGTPGQCTPCPSGSTYCGGACIDTTSSNTDCGGCGLACPSGCAAGRCVVTIASGLDGPFSIALGPSDVYFTQTGVTGGANGGVLKVSKAGGVVGTISSPETQPDDLQVDGTNVYWIAGNLKKKAIAGGPVTTLSSRTNASYSLALDSSSSTLFWTYDDSTAPANGIVFAMSTGGAAMPTSLGNGYGVIATDGAYVYFTTPTTIARAPIAGGATMTVAAATGLTNTGRGMAVDARNLYWLEYSDGMVRQTQSDGTGPLVTLAAGQASPTTIAIDASTVYWVNRAGDVRKTAIGGAGPVVTLTTGLASPWGIAIDGTSAYVANWANAKAGAGSIVKITPR